MDKKDQIFRLLNYKNLLHRLSGLGFKKIFSDNISDTLGISSSLVRKDFSFFGIKGSQKGGYDIDIVIRGINEILGKNEIQKVIVIGVGRIGEALLNYKGFSSEGIRIIAGFDIDSLKFNPNSEIPIYSINKIAEYVKENNIKIAIMAVPHLAAQQTLEILKAANIEGVLNFTSAKLGSTEGIVIGNVNIINELEKLIYLVKNQSKM